VLLCSEDGITLTHLSSGGWCCFKAKLKSKNSECPDAEEVLLWNVAKTLGMESARTTTLKSTFYSKERGYRFAVVAGANWQTAISNGENMEGFGLNTARSFLGRNVNLHLKDGSVIINVQLAGIMKDEFRRDNLVTCVPYGNRATLRVPIKNIAWAELLNLNLILAGG
jgi:hypothetical protein